MTTGDDMSPRARRIVILSAIGLVALYVGGAWLGTHTLRGYAAGTAREREARLKSADAHSHAPRTASGAKPVEVHVALTMNRLGEFSLKEAAWTADFNVSLRWTGDGVNPGETFRVVNGQILQRDKADSYERGGERYEEYHVIARVTKVFDAAAFPFGDDVLLVELEDAIHGPEALVYVTDARDTGLRPGAFPGLASPTRILAGVAYPAEAGAIGGASAAGGPQGSRSRFYFAMIIVPASLGIYFPMFQALFASVAIALIACFIKPIHVDPRFGLPVGAFFASVTNNVALASVLPLSDGFTLAKMVNLAGTTTLFLILVESAVSLYLFDTLGRERLSRFLDHVFFVAILAGFVIVNLVLPLAAKPA